LMRTFIAEPFDLAHRDTSPIVDVSKQLNHSFRLISRDKWWMYTEAQRKQSARFESFYHPEAPLITRNFEDGRAALNPFWKTYLYLTICLSFAEKHNKLKSLLF